MRHGLQLADITLVWLVCLNIDWDCLVPYCIMDSWDQWEFPPFFKPQWQSLCTALPAGKCLPLGLCKGTVKESNCCLRLSVNISGQSDWFHWKLDDLEFINIPNQWLRFLTRFCWSFRKIFLMWRLTQWGMRQNSCLLADGIFKLDFLLENCCLSISLEFAPKGPIKNMPSLFDIMACYQTGSKSKTCTHMNS